MTESTPARSPATHRHRAPSGALGRWHDPRADHEPGAQRILARQLVAVLQPPVQHRTPTRHRPAGRRGVRPGWHPAWTVVAATFLALLTAAAFRSAPGVLVEPLHTEFGWSISTISVALFVNLALYGLAAPFSAALMENFGIRRVVSSALLVVAAGAGLTMLMTRPAQLVLAWGVIIGAGSGAMAAGLIATVVNRWFAARRGLVSGVLIAAGATGQLVFLPLVAHVAEAWGWRAAALTITVLALAVVPVVLLFLRDRPADVGVLPFGADEPGTATGAGDPERSGTTALALGALGDAVRRPVFWLLAGGFFVCGASTAGLVQSHFIPAAHDHGMPATTAAGVLAVVGVFDLVGTIGSGWLTDRYDPRVLLGCYYALRGISLATLVPLLGGATTTLSVGILAFAVVFGLDWVATVPPTLALCREHFGADGAIVFGWIFAVHQLGAACSALAGGMLRDALGSYDQAWFGSAVLCGVAALLSLLIRKAPAGVPTVRDGRKGLAR